LSEEGDSLLDFTPVLVFWICTTHFGTITEFYHQRVCLDCHLRCFKQTITLSH